MFKSGMPVYGKDFIDRKKHLTKFNAYISGNQHIMIKAPRRFGKTSMIVHIFETYKYPKIYIDVKRAVSLARLSEQIIDEAYKHAGIDGIVQKAKESVSGLFRQLRATLKIDFEVAELTVETLEKNEKNRLDETEFFLYAIELVETIAKKREINIKLAFDEFQDILDIADSSLLDKMRSVAQHHQNVTYIFLGSVESVMNKIFSNKSSAFFHFARVIELDGLDTEEVVSFCKEFFGSEGIVCDDFLFELVRRLEGHPYYTMKTLQSAYYKALEDGAKSISKNDCLEAVTVCLFETKPYLEEIIEKIKQKKYHYAVLWSLANNQKERRIDSQTLYKTYKSLENTGHIKKTGRGEYALSDIFLKILLRRGNDFWLARPDIGIDDTECIFA